MHHGDVSRIAAIEQASVSPWSAQFISGELERSHGLQLVAINGIDETILGWCCCLYTASEAELLKIAVAPLQRHHGVGTALLLRLEDGCRDQGCLSIFLEVRAANTTAIGLYEKLKYLRIGCRKKYYNTPQDDALILRKTLLAKTSNLPFSGDLHYENSSGS
jgi:[ribosomal protein S18]-alanine N-acetyltransferase